MALLFWLVVIFGACALVAAVDEILEARDRRRRIQRLRERRRHLDNLEPQRWDRKAA